MASLKQKRAVALMVENGGNASKAMRDAGYSHETAKNPDKLTKSLGFKSIAQSIPDVLLSERHLELLNKRETKNVTVKKKDINGIEKTVTKKVDIGPDVFAVKHGLDMAYKIKGTYAPEKTVNLNIEIESDPLVKDLTSKLNEIYRGASESGDGGAAGSLGTEA